MAPETRLRMSASSRVLALLLLLAPGRHPLAGQTPGVWEVLPKPTRTRSFNPRFFHPSLSVVRDTAAWAALWAPLPSHSFEIPTLLPTDFRTEVILVAADSTGEGSAEIVAVLRRGTALQVIVRRIIPPQGCWSIDGHPWAMMVVVPQPADTIVWTRFPDVGGACW